MEWGRCVGGCEVDCRAVRVGDAADLTEASTLDEPVGTGNRWVEVRRGVRAGSAEVGRPVRLFGERAAVSEISHGYVAACQA